MDINQIIHQLNIWLIPVIFAITLHEVAHGFVASLFGDQTAKMLGRLSVNPIKHTDPIGTILVPASAFFLSGFVFGWAKPVPITIQNLKNPKQDMFWIALAGPFANLLMALFWVLLLKFTIELNGYSDQDLIVQMAIAGVQINITLMIFNLLPLPPLDGGRVLSSLLPNHLSWQLSKIEPYGFFIVIGLLSTGFLTKIILVPMQFTLKFLYTFVGLI